MTLQEAYEKRRQEVLSLQRQVKKLQKDFFVYDASADGDFYSLPAFAEGRYCDKFYIIWFTESSAYDRSQLSQQRLPFVYARHFA